MFQESFDSVSSSIKLRIISNDSTLLSTPVRNCSVGQTHIAQAYSRFHHFEAKSAVAMAGPRSHGKNRSLLHLVTKVFFESRRILTSGVCLGVGVGINRKLFTYFVLRPFLPLDGTLFLILANYSLFLFSLCFSLTISHPRGNTP